MNSLEAVQLSKQAGLPKVFAIGFNKCGTTSLTHLFRSAGHRSIHNGTKNSNGKIVRLAEQMFLNRAAGNKLLRGMDNAVFYSDMESVNSTWCLNAITLFRDLDKHYPGSKFILNLREKEKWLRSRANFRDGQYLEVSCRAHGLQDSGEMRKFWASEWDSHLEAVRNYFSDRKDDFLEFDIEGGDIDEFCDFFDGYGLDPKHWTAKNVNESLNLEVRS